MRESSAPTSSFRALARRLDDLVRALADLAQSLAFPWTWVARLEAPEADRDLLMLEAIREVDRVGTILMIDEEVLWFINEERMSRGLDPIGPAQWLIQIQSETGKSQ